MVFQCRSTLVLYLGIIENMYSFKSLSNLRFYFLKICSLKLDISQRMFPPERHPKCSPNTIDDGKKNV